MNNLELYIFHSDFNITSIIQHTSRQNQSLSKQKWTKTLDWIYLREDSSCSKSFSQSSNTLALCATSAAVRQSAKTSKTFIITVRILLLPVVCEDEAENYCVIWQSAVLSCYTLTKRCIQFHIFIKFCIDWLRVVLVDQNFIVCHAPTSSPGRRERTPGWSRLH